MRSAGLISVLLSAAGLAQVPGSGPLAQQPRVATSQEVAEAARPAALLPLRFFFYPYSRVMRGMERGLVAFEQHKIRERAADWQANLLRRGGALRFGGSGEGSGIGGGLDWTIRTGSNHGFGLLANVTAKWYQEFGVNWGVSSAHARLVLESSYQWRPQENFYGIGHDSLREKHSQFALRQTWAGVRSEVAGLRQRLRAGVLYRAAWVSALPGRNPAYSSPDAFFPDLAGYGTQTRLETVGVYVDLDGLRQGLREDYRFGGALHAGASRQRGLGGANLKYYSYEAQLEGRLPVVPDNSVLVGQANFEFNRLSGASGPIPFFLLPHIGGSATLRGLALDRFYGPNLMLLSLEYRYKMHPNIQAVPFFDEGQIFQRTSDLSWLHWHRTYGIGFRFRASSGATVLRVNYGRSSEGYQIDVTFGDRARPPMRGPIRSGGYKR